MLVEAGQLLQSATWFALAAQGGRQNEEVSDSKAADWLNFIYQIRLKYELIKKISTWRGISVIRPI